MAIHRAPLLVVLLSVWLGALSGECPGATGGYAPLAVPVYDYELLNIYPHDTGAFTQGLYYQDGYFYESTGLYSQSTVRKVVPETGDVVKIHYMPDAYFGEGLTVRNDTIHQLTYVNYTAFTYVELDTFAMVDSFPYAFRGWGLTHDDTSLIASDGSHRLYHLNPQNYEEVSRLNVTLEGAWKGAMNEMEMIQGRIYANIYGLDSVAIIVPETGVIEAWIDLSGLRGYISSGGVLNGIAWDPDNFRMFATGKQWSHMFHIFVETINYPLEIVWSDPPPQFCTEVDSTVVLAVSVADPNGAEELEYTWTVNGVVDPAVQDSFYNYSSAVPTVDTVAVVVSDGMFTDSRSWLAVVSTSGVEDGFEINSIGGPTVRPNPFSRSTEICFEVSRGYGESRLAELTVYDVEGKSVKTLVDSELEPGKHTVFWDATDRYGDRVSAGIYLVKIRVGDETMSGKIAVLE